MPNTIDQKQIPDPWAAVDRLIGELWQAEQRPRDYLFTLRLWDVTVRLFRWVETRQLIEREPTPEDLKIHEGLLSALLSIGLLLEAGKINDAELAYYGVGRPENLTAYIRELRDTWLMWHGPELEPARAAELEKAIFGGAT
jgi:hypothetical protein